MSKEPDTEQLFADLRKSLNAEENATNPAGSDKERPSDSLTTEASAIDDTVTKEINTETEASGPAADWRTAETASTYVDDEASDQTAPQPSIPDRTKTMPQTKIHDTPAPATTSETWRAEAVTPSAPKHGIRVGLLVWGALLVVSGIFIMLTLFLPTIGGPIVMATMLTILGVFFLVGAVASAVRKKG